MDIENIQNKIQASFTESEVHVIDTTGTNDHFRVIVISDLFKDKSTLQRHKMIYNIFPDELKSGELHALEIKTFTKDEYSNF